MSAARRRALPFSAAPLAFDPIPLRAITCIPLAWLWEPYLARGKLAVLDGDPGTGKSFVTLDLAARVSRGAALPECRPAATSETAGAGEAGRGVLLLSAEDDARDTIGPRLAAAGGDPDRVRVFYAPGLGLDWMPRFPDHADLLAEAVRKTSAALVVVDPLPAFFGPEVNANTDASVREALWPLSKLAAETGACVLVVRHLRKAGGASAVHRGAGSVGILGAAPTGLMLVRHPDDPGLRVLTMSKTNVGPPGRSLGVRLVRDAASGQTVVNWTGPLDVSADDLLGSGMSARACQRARERAAEWLREFLASGPRRSPEVEAAAAEAGIPPRTLRRAKEMIGAAAAAVRREGRLEWWWQVGPLTREEVRAAASVFARSRAYLALPPTDATECAAPHVGSCESGDSAAEGA